MKVIAVLLLVLASLWAFNNFMPLMFLTGGAIVFLVKNDTDGAAIEGFYDLGFGVMLVAGAMLVGKSLFS